MPDDRFVISGRDVSVETVGELLDAVRRLVQEEELRDASLNSRAAGLTGIVGVLLSIAAAASATGAGTDAKASFSHLARVVSGLLIASALIVLVLAVVAVVRNVLLAGQRLAIPIEEVRRYPTFRWITRERVHVQGYLMNGYIAALEFERRRNDLRATWLRRSYVLVLLGIVFVTVAGVTATVDRYVV